MGIFRKRKPAVRLTVEVLEEIVVKGVKDRQAVIPKVGKHPFLLRAEPTNPHDRYAVQVLNSRGVQVGYLPTEDAQQLTEFVQAIVKRTKALPEVEGEVMPSRYGDGQRWILLTVPAPKHWAEYVAANRIR